MEVQGNNKTSLTTTLSFLSNWSNLNVTDVTTTLDEGLDLDDEEEAVFIFDLLYVQIIFVVLYTIVFCFCVFGNILVLLVISLHWKMKITTRFCLANLCVADLCVGIFCIYQNLSTYLISSWVLGVWLCKMYQFVHALSLTSSILILVVISIERYLAIIHPLHCRQILTLNRLMKINATVWVISGLYCSPRLYYMTTINVPTYDGGIEVICTAKRTLFDSKTFDMVNAFLMFLLPLALITVLYTRIGITLWRSSHGHGETNWRGPRVTSRRSFLNHQNDSMKEDSFTDPPPPPPSRNSRYGHGDVIGGGVGVGVGRSSSVISMMKNRRNSRSFLSSTTTVGGAVSRKNSRYTRQKMHQSQMQYCGDVGDEDDCRCTMLRGVEGLVSMTTTTMIMTTKERGGASRVNRQERDCYCQNDNCQSERCCATSYVDVQTANEEEEAKTHECYVVTTKKVDENNRNEDDKVSEDSVCKFCHLHNVVVPSASEVKREEGEGGGVAGVAATATMVAGRQESCRKKKSVKMKCLLLHRHGENGEENEEGGFVPKMITMDGQSFDHLSSIRGTKRRRQNLNFGHQQPNSRQRVIRMFLVIVITFAIFNSPYHIRKVVLYWWPEFLQKDNVWAVLSTPLSHLCLYANCASNPIIYSFLSSSFRACVKDLVCCKWRKGFSASNKTKHSQLP